MKTTRNSFHTLATMKIIATAIAASLALAPLTHAEVFGGIDFPQGAASFADRVVSYAPGSPPPTHPAFVDPVDALGPPDHPGGDDAPGSVSLGVGGVIILEFTNNVLTGSDDTEKDVHIFEVGSDVEDTFVEISTDGITWHPVGKVFGSTSSIDIDAFGFTSAHQFRFVRLTDDPAEGQTSGDTVGADIDAVGAISTTPVDDNPQLTIRHSGKTAYSVTIQTQAPVAYWRLNEASGAVADNVGSLGSAADGAYGANVELDVPGLRAASHDAAINFPSKSTGNRMVVTGFAMPAAAVTISFLVRGQDNALSSFFGYGAGSQANEFTFASNSGNFESNIKGSNASFNGVDVLDGSIHHIAITWTNTTGLMQLYVDGQFVNSRTASMGASLTSGGVLALGQDLDNLTPPNYGFSAAQSLVATIDEFAVFDRVLTGSEIGAQHLAATSPANTMTASEFFLEFDSAFGSTYVIEESINLQDWPDLFTDIYGTGGKMRFVIETTSSRMFYRLD